jgi:hypothetical protein
MDRQLQALAEIRAFLDQHEIRHVVIGGIANAVWGRPRGTLDADLKVLLGDLGIRAFVELLGATFRLRVPDPLPFVRRTYVAPILASNDVGLDLAVGFLPYEYQTVERAVLVQYHGVAFPVCTAEDFIIHKAISERPKDWADIEGVLARQAGALDQPYIMRWLEEFSHALDRPELTQRYRDLLSRLQ